MIRCQNYVKVFNSYSSIENLVIRLKIGKHLYVESTTTSLVCRHSKGKKVWERGYGLTSASMLLTHTYSISTGFLRKVYGILTAQLILSVLVALVCMSVPSVREFVQTRYILVFMSVPSGGGGGQAC